MTRLFFLISLIFILGVGVGYLWQEQQSQNSFFPNPISDDRLTKNTIIIGGVKAEILRIIDGDTFEVRAFLWEGLEKTATIRLSNVNTPEKRRRSSCSICENEKKLAQAANDYVEKLIGVEANGKWRQVYLHNPTTALYGRISAQITNADGIDLGSALIEKGLAKRLIGGKKACWCN